MRLLSFLLCIWTTVALTRPLAAQALTLDEAVRIALDHNPAVQASEAGIGAAAAGIQAAGARRLPSLGYDESYTRSNNPVFVFGSLLNQRRFGPENFEIEALNNPDSLQNFQSLLRLEQSVYDFGRTRHALRAARILSELSLEERRASHANVILAVVETYFGGVLAAEQLEVAAESVETARSDLRKTESLAAAGMATRADVLSARVHLSSVEEEQIKASHQVFVVRAALNQALGLDQNGSFDLVTPLTPPPGDVAPLEDYVERAQARQPDSRRARLHTELARQEVLRARSDLWPEVRAQGVLEADRGRMFSQGGGNWLAAISLHWDIWQGSGKRATIAGADQAHRKAEALERAAIALSELRTRQAFFGLKSATERVEVAESSVAQARESHRIIQNRYEAGLENVTELIRSQLALKEAQLRHLNALYDQRVSRVALEHAAGDLTPTSEALK